MGFWGRLLGKKEKVVHVTLSPESIRDSPQIKALAYENAELKGKNAKKDKIIAEYRERDQDLKEEENIKIELDEQKKELRTKSQGKVLLLRKFYAKLLRDKDFAKKLGFYSFDRKTRLANFGDLGISEDGDFVLLDDNGQMLLRMKTLPDMLQSPGALGNDMYRGIIPVNLDSEGSYIENVMIYEAPELIQTGDKLRFAKARKKPVYEIIKGLNKQISELHLDLEEAEETISELQQKNDELMSMQKIHEDMSETAKAESSHVKQRAVGIDRVFGSIERDMLIGQNIIAIQEDNIGKLEREVKHLIEEAERQGVKLSDEKALELFQQIRSTLVNEMPDFQPQSAEQSNTHK